MQTVSYLSNDLTCGLSPMDTSLCSHILEGYVACLPGLCHAREHLVCSQRWLSKGGALCCEPIQALDNAEMGNMLGWLGG